MTEDSGPRVSSDVSTDTTQTRQRKKRKWDQPAESLLNYPLGNIVSHAGISLPGLVPSVSAAGILSNPLAPGCATIPSVVLQGSSVPKLNQPKIQDELVIAREIVINDAESSLRYKLTKRQTQEEIQKCTGAVVITRGKYRPPNAPPDGEKPLYLHISAAAHLKETAERIISVDRAAAMIEEMLKQGQNSHTSFTLLQTVVNNGVKAMSTCVYLGFDADPSLNIATRIRGPNDQYINHIMNETGAIVMLKGRGSGTFEGPQGEEVHQPLHLFLSSNNPKSLEDAKRLAENLLDTILLECGASRAPSCKVYTAVPPPQWLTGVQSSGSEQKVNTNLAAGLTSTVSITLAPPVPSVTASGVATVYSQATLTQSGGTLNCPQHQPNMVGSSQPVISRGTSYSGYEGLYPQATPLQQVALALRQSTSPITPTVAPTTAAASTARKSNVSYMSEKEKRPPQKRKFQELPVGSKGPSKLNQASERPTPSESSTDLDVRNVSNMPAPKKLVQTLSNRMPPLPPRSMPPPPPLKFTSSPSTTNSHDKKNSLNKTKSDNVPDTLVKLMEYGDGDDDDEDDDAEDDDEESFSGDSGFSVNSSNVSVRKPFWAL